MIEAPGEVFETGRPLPARRLCSTRAAGPRVESVVTLTPVVRYGKVVEVAVWRAIHAVGRRAARTARAPSRLVAGGPARRGRVGPHRRGEPAPRGPRRAPRGLARRARRRADRGTAGGRCACSSGARRAAPPGHAAATARTTSLLVTPEGARARSTSSSRRAPRAAEPTPCSWTGRRGGACSRSSMRPGSPWRTPGRRRPRRSPSTTHDLKAAIAKIVEAARRRPTKRPAPIPAAERRGRAHRDDGPAARAASRPARPRR